MFLLGQFWLDKVGKVSKYSGNTSSAFSELKMEAVYTRKKGLSRLYDRKFAQSNAISRGGIICPHKRRNQAHWA